MGQGDDQRELTGRWVQEHADRDHGGDFISAAVCLLNGARLREQNPDKLWIELEARQRGRK